MKTKIITIILLVCSTNFALAVEYHKHQESIGAPADHPRLDDVPIPKVEFSKTGKALLTLNKHGFDVVSTDRNWVTQLFLQFCSKHQDEFVLDVGSGYGALTREALKVGVRVISNDMDHRHLYIGRNEIKNKERLTRLTLNNRKFPDYNLPDNLLQAVILHRVLNFIPGEKIDIGLKKIHKWLKPGGKVFIVAMSAEHVAFKGEEYYRFNHNKHAGEYWPGENINVARSLPEQAYALPDRIHIMDQDILAHALKRNGFKVERSGFVSMKHFGNDERRDGREAVGIIGVKK